MTFAPAAIDPTSIASSVSKNALAGVTTHSTLMTCLVPPKILPVTVGIHTGSNITKPTSTRHWWATMSAVSQDDIPEKWQPNEHSAENIRFKYDMAFAVGILLLGIVMVLVEGRLLLAPRLENFPGLVSWRREEEEERLLYA
ncbi:hypothetical protein N0V90_003625 [Kalmusia sp. IMI 367209]|nr:hypothetical protein N0V90_003625 [Kalmusia sp. IMI 367209]